MKVFRELRISGAPEVLQTAVADIERHLSNGWQRDTESEKALGSNPYPMYCFRCADSGERSASALWLVLEPRGNLYVSNIVPEKKHELSYDEYNAVLEDFHQRLVLPAAVGKAVAVVFTPADEDVDAWMSSSTADLLRPFVRSANKTTGTSHPYDRERWNAFLVAAHQEGASLDASTLHRWLVESERWSDDIAWRTAVEYETGRGLLEYYDKACSITAG